MLVVWSWPGVTGASLSKVNLGFKFPMIMKYSVSVALASIITILYSSFILFLAEIFQKQTPPVTSVTE